MHRAREKKIVRFQSNGWGKSADKDAIVRQIFIRILEILYCAKIGGLRVAGIAEVEKDGETGFWSPKTVKELISLRFGAFGRKTLLAPHLSICKFDDVKNESNGHFMRTYRDCWNNCILSSELERKKMIVI